MRNLNGDEELEDAMLGEDSDPQPESELDASAALPVIPPPASGQPAGAPVEDDVLKRYFAQAKQRQADLASAEDLAQKNRLVARLGGAFNTIGTSLGGTRTDNSSFDQMAKDANEPVARVERAQKSQGQQDRVVNDYMRNKIRGDLIGKKLESSAAAGAKKAEDKTKEDNEKFLSDIRGEYLKHGVTKMTPEVETIYKNIEKAAKGKGPGNDISLIYGIMKMYDPSSSVREGEFATAQNSGSVPTQLMNSYNRAVNGGRLSSSQKLEFLNTAKDRLQSQYTTQDNIDNYYRNILKTKGADETQVILPRSVSFKPVEVAVKKPKAGGGLSTDEQKELEALEKKYGK